jgi:hypothetical protein
MNAAIGDDPGRAKSVDAALKSLAHTSYRPVLIDLLASS